MHAASQEDEIAAIGLAKDLSSLSRQAEGDYELVYEFVIANVGSVSLMDLSLIDALSPAFPEPAEFTILEIASTDFAVNTAFNGTSDIELLGPGNELDIAATGTVTLRIRVTPNKNPARYENSATIYGKSPSGQTVTDVSTSGTDPDPDGDADPTNNSQITEAAVVDLELGGLFQSTISAAQAQDISVDGMTISLFAILGDFAAQMDASFSQLSADTLNINASGALGNIKLNSGLAFNISPAEFVSWQAGAAFKLLDIDFTDIATITVPQSSSYNQLSWSASGDKLSAQGTWKFDLCPPAFSAVNTCVTFDWLECDTSVTGCVTFTADEGFSVATISLADYVLFEDVMGVTGSLSGTISYTTTEKLVSPRLNLTTDWFVCPDIEVLAEFDISSSATLTVDGALIYGIKGEIPVGPATFRFAESFSDSKNSSVTGKADYFEQLGLSVEIPGCCGPPGSLDFDAYFERIPSGSLFSWGLMTMCAEIHLTEGVSFALDTQFANDAPKWAFSLSTKVFW